MAALKIKLLFVSWHWNFTENIQLKHYRDIIVDNAGLSHPSLGYAEGLICRKWYKVFMQLFLGRQCICP